jgi:MYXO-CTERM domain-containing protein
MERKGGKHVTPPPIELPRGFFTPLLKDPESFVSVHDALARRWIEGQRNGRKHVMKKITSMIALAGVAALATSAFGQGTLTSGNAVFRIASYPTTAGGLATTVNQNAADMRLAGAGGTDQAWDFQWWYRFSTDTRERTLVSPTGGTWPAGSSGGNGFTLSGATGVTATTSYDLSDPDGAGGNLGYALSALLTISNNGPSAVNMSVFSYFDTFLNGGDAGDVASLFSPDTLSLSQASTQLYYRGIGAQNFLVAPWGGTTGAGAVADAAITNYNNTITGSGGADIAAGWQWTNVVIEPGASISLRAVVSSDPTFIPTPGAAAIMGLAGLAGIRRRR